MASEREFVTGSGMTEGEADCWELTVQFARGFFALPELHASHRQEVVQAIHVLQNHLLARPTYRRYLELAGMSVPDSP